MHLVRFSIIYVLIYCIISETFNSIVYVCVCVYFYSIFVWAILSRYQLKRVIFECPLVVFVLVLLFFFSQYGTKATNNALIFHTHTFNQHHNDQCDHWSLITIQTGPSQIILFASLSICLLFEIGCYLQLCISSFFMIASISLAHARQWFSCSLLLISCEFLLNLTVI